MGENWTMAVSAQPASPAAGRVLDTAERLAQVRGFNGFSYADISAELGITKASVHYHFASKADLGSALMARYAQRFAAALAELDAADLDAPGRLAGYAGLYADVLRDGRMCLCGMLAAEVETLPAPMQAAIVSFFASNEAWLCKVLEQGRSDGTLSFAGPAADAAGVIVSTLEGAMLVARSTREPQRFETAAQHVLARFRPPDARGA